MNANEKLDYAIAQMRIAHAAQFDAPSEDALIDARESAGTAVEDAFNAARAENNLKLAVYCSCMSFATDEIKQMGVEIANRLLSDESRVVKA